MKYIMRIIFKYIAFGIALLASSFVLNAQTGTYHEEGGMATSKKVTGPEGGYYTIELESFATGETTVTESSTPVDIVLVLDVSGSMDQAMAEVRYTARNRQGYTYNNYGNNTYYYKHTDGNYYAVARWRPGNNSGNRFLRFNVNGTYWYLSGTDTEATTTQPTGTTTGGATIWTGVLYEQSNVTKMEALKEAVGVFIDEVAKNASEDSQGNPRSVDNRISIVKFAGLGNNNPGYYTDATQYQPSGNGNHRNDDNYNYTEVVAGLTSVLDGGAASLKTTINSLNAGGATAANGGMQLAVNIVSRIPSDRESNKVVVMFTDGQPTYQSAFSNTVANGTVTNARTLKTTYGATVYTIGVFDNETTQIRNYMTYTSSNYPNAQGPNNNGQYTPGAGSDQGYYQNASNADLTEIFKSIAHASGASDATAGASTQVRDVVSNSFIMPEGEAAQVTIKVADITSDGEGWSTPVTAEGVSYEITTVTSSTGEEHKQLMVTGFDYTKADVLDDDGFTVTPGNWVGERYSDATTKYWAGKKLIISFKIKANDEATGGDGANTNHPDSGIYVQRFNEDGTPVIVDGKPVYDRVNQYDVPHTNLPLLIKITKDGLRTGESATFQIMRIRPKVDAEGNYVTNAIGKPEPNTHTFDPTPKKPGDPALNPDDPMDYLEGTGWEDWSKVILTNKGADKARVEKDLYGLDPGWVYIVVEDDWGWTYTLTGSASSMTTANTEINPFNFHNEPRTVNLNGDPIVKHAEAVTINHFETLEGEGAREEHYKSSKVILNNQ